MDICGNKGWPDDISHWKLSADLHQSLTDLSKELQLLEAVQGPVPVRMENHEGSGHIYEFMTIITLLKLKSEVNLLIAITH